MSAVRASALPALVIPPRRSDSPLECSDGMSPHQLAKAGAEPGDAVMIGDTPWDVEAAKKAGLPTVAVLTGGFSEQELRDAGAIAVFETIPDLRAGLSDTPLG